MILTVLDETLTGQTSVCGVLKVLAGMLKHGKRDDLIEFGNLFILLYDIDSGIILCYSFFIQDYRSLTVVESVYLFKLL